jgi:hypothetical protein
MPDILHMMFCEASYPEKGFSAQWPELAGAGIPPAAVTGFRRLWAESGGWYERSKTGPRRPISDFHGRTLFVDDVFGDDAIAARTDPSLPYKTIEAAIADALAGDAILVGPGTYTLAAGITIPDDVLLRGVGVNVVTIQMTGVTADTTLVTMGDNSRVEDVTLRLTSAQHHTLKGVLFPGTTTETARLRTTVVEVDNSGAGAGASNVYGVHSNGTGVPGEEMTTIRACTINVQSTGTGAKRGVLVDTASRLILRDTNVVCEGAGGGTFYGVETNHASAIATLIVGRVLGTTADISRTLGTLSLAATHLANALVNGLSFTPKIASNNLYVGDDASLPSNATRYFHMGIGQLSASEVKVRIPRATVIQSLVLRALTAPGVGKTDTVTVRKNGVDTTLTASLVGAAVSAQDLANAVSFAAGDDLSIKIVTAIATATSDLSCSLELY